MIEGSLKANDLVSFFNTVWNAAPKYVGKMGIVVFHRIMVFQRWRRALIWRLTAALVSLLRSLMFRAWTCVVSGSLPLTEVPVSGQAATWGFDRILIWSIQIPRQPDWCLGSLHVALFPSSSCYQNGLVAGRRREKVSLENQVTSFCLCLKRKIKQYKQFWKLD